jgi:hypothetical protein
VSTRQAGDPPVSRERSQEKDSETRGRRQIVALDAEPRRHRLDVNDMDESDRPQLKHIEVPGSVINVEAVL